MNHCDFTAMIKARGVKNLFTNKPIALPNQIFFAKTCQTCNLIKHLKHEV